MCFWLNALNKVCGWQNIFSCFIQQHNTSVIPPCDFFKACLEKGDQNGATDVVGDIKHRTEEVYTNLLVCFHSLIVFRIAFLQTIVNQI